MNKTRKRTLKSREKARTRGRRGGAASGGAASEEGAASEGGASEPEFKSRFPQLSTPLERTQKNSESANQWTARIDRINKYEKSTKNAREKEKEKWIANKLVAKELVALNPAPAPVFRFTPPGNRSAADRYNLGRSRG